MEIKLIGCKCRLVPDLKKAVKRGDSFTCSEDVGKSLLNQNNDNQIIWEVVKKNIKKDGER